MRVLAIDPGLKNLGFAYVVDGKLARFGVFNAVNRVEKKHKGVLLSPATLGVSRSTQRETLLTPRSP